MKAMILAAGRGERLRPLTDMTPKPLLEAGGRPLIVRMIEQLVAAGMTDLVINLGYRGRQIQETLGGGDAWGARIVYSREPEAALETGGGIFKALPHLSDPCLVVNGDVATDFPFAELPRNPRGLAHLVLVPNPPHHPGGDFTLREGRVLPAGVSEPTYTFSGIGIYSHALFCHCRPGRFALAPLLRRGIAEGSVSGQLYRGFWSDIGTPERLKAWDRELKRRGGEP
ncbi:MAG: N-acetylmuramate alpha-1-phosphate uridylyltransferase MurU [Methylohalobius sp. ZOD2]